MANYIPQIIYPSGGGTTLTFSLPLDGDPKEEKIKAVNHTVVTANGQVQNAHDYLEEIIAPKFALITKTEADALRTWFKASAGKKIAFDWYESNDEAITGTYTMVDNTFGLDRIGAGASSDFLYECSFKMRRVVT